MNITNNLENTFSSSYTQSDQILLTTCVLDILLYHKALKVSFYPLPFT